MTSVYEDLPSSSDDIVFELANSEDRILVTLDKDFGELVNRLNRNHHQSAASKFTLMDRSQSHFLKWWNVEIAGDFHIPPQIKHP